MTTVDQAIRQSAATRARYDRIAPMYDAMECFTERAAFGAWRQQLWAGVSADRVLEVGAGTGKNLPCYPPGARMTAIDLSDRMLLRARLRAAELGVKADLRLMDVQHLEFPDDTFHRDARRGGVTCGLTSSWLVRRNFLAISGYTELVSWRGANG